MLYGTAATLAAAVVRAQSVAPPAPRPPRDQRRQPAAPAAAARRRSSRTSPRCSPRAASGRRSSRAATDGRRRRAGVTIVSDGTTVLAPLERAGDEPLMLARALPGVAGARLRRIDMPPAASPRRTLGATVHVLDDGFQHLGLERDVDLLIVCARGSQRSGAAGRPAARAADGGRIGRCAARRRLEPGRHRRASRSARRRHGVPRRAHDRHATLAPLRTRRRRSVAGDVDRSPSPASRARIASSQTSRLRGLAPSGEAGVPRSSSVFRRRHRRASPGRRATPAQRSS